MSEMDAKDHEILFELERDGRITNLALAAKVGLSPSACLRRVQEMERSGAIAGYRVVTNRTAMGVGFNLGVFGGCCSTIICSLWEALLRSAFQRGAEFQRFVW